MAAILIPDKVERGCSGVQAVVSHGGCVLGGTCPVPHWPAKAAFLVEHGVQGGLRWSNSSREKKKNKNI